MVLVNLAIILVAIGFIIVLQLHDPTFVSSPNFLKPIVIGCLKFRCVAGLEHWRRHPLLRVFHGPLRARVLHVHLSRERAYKTRSACPGRALLDSSLAKGTMLFPILILSASSVYYKRTILSMELT